MSKSKHIPQEVNFNARFSVARQKPSGANPGGFFHDNKTGKTVYIKWLAENLTENEKNFYPSVEDWRKKYSNRNRNRLNNEFLALKLYELYQVPFPKNPEFFTFQHEGTKYYAISGEEEADIAPFCTATQNASIISQNAHPYFLIHCLMSNYDVVGGEGDNIFYNIHNGSVFHLDPGGALLYLAQGKPKKDINEFTGKVGEFMYLSHQMQHNTQYNKNPLSWASQVYQGIHRSPALLISLKKLLSVDDSQIKECVENYGFDIIPGTKGKKRNDKVIQRLAERKQHLTELAKNEILNSMNSANCRDYLEKANMSLSTIKGIVSEFNQNPPDRERIWLRIENEIAPLQNSGIIQNNTKGLCALAGVSLANIKITYPGTQQALECVQLSFTNEKDYHDFLKKTDRKLVMGFWKSGQSNQWNVQLFPSFVKFSGAYRQAIKIPSDTLHTFSKLTNEQVSSAIDMVKEQLTIFPVHVQLEYLGLFYNEVAKRKPKPKEVITSLRNTFCDLACKSPQDEKVGFVVAKYASDIEGIVNSQHNTAGYAGSFFGKITGTREKLNDNFKNLSIKLSKTSKALVCAIRDNAKVDHKLPFTNVYEGEQHFVFCFSNQMEANHFKQISGVVFELLADNFMAICPKEKYFDCYIKLLVNDKKSSLHNMEPDKKIEALEQLKTTIQSCKYENFAMKKEHMALLDKEIGPQQAMKTPSK